MGFSKEHDATGLAYYGYRYYSPELGRWTTRDPIGEEGGAGLFTFVSNMPVSRWDLLGTIPTPIPLPPPPSLPSPLPPVPTPVAGKCYEAQIGDLTSVSCGAPDPTSAGLAHAIACASLSPSPGDAMQHWLMGFGVPCSDVACPNKKGPPTFPSDLTVASSVVVQMQTTFLSTVYVCTCSVTLGSPNKVKVFRIIEDEECCEEE